MQLVEVDEVDQILLVPSPEEGSVTSIHLVKDDLRPPGPAARRHLISIADLTRDDVERLLGTAHVFEGSLTGT